MKRLIIYTSLLLTCSLTGLHASDWQDNLRAANALNEASRNDSALVLSKLALGQAEHELGTDDQVIPGILSECASIQIDRRKYDKAISLINRGLDIIEEHGRADSNSLKLLDELAIVYFTRVQSGNFRVTIDKALKIYKSLYGEEKNCFLAKLYGTYAMQLGRDGNFDKAESLLSESLQIFEASPNEHFHDILVEYSRLASLYEDQAMYDKAEQYYKQALRAVSARNDQQYHMWVVLLHKYANLTFKQGKVKVADSLYQRTIGLEERYDQEDRLYLAKVLISAASFYTYTKRLIRAESYLLKARKIYKQELGEQDPSYADVINRLGRLYTVQKRYSEAEALLQESLAIRGRVYGMEHEYVSHSLNNLGNLYFAQGDFARAKRDYTRALEIRENLFGQFHPYVFLLMQSLAKLYAASGEISQSLDYYDRSIYSLRKFLEYSFSSASEEQKLRWIRKYPPLNNSLLSLAIGQRSERSIEAAYNMVLWGKSLVVDALMKEKSAAVCSSDPELDSLLEKRNSVRTLIANVALGKITSPEQTHLREELPTLMQEQDSLEAMISTRCADFGDYKLNERLNDSIVRANIPPNSVLLEFVRYRPYDFVNRRSSDADHYLVFALAHSDTTRIYDCGNATLIDSLVMQGRNILYAANRSYYLGNIGKSETRLKQLNTRLYDLLLSPMSDKLRHTSEIIISPDGTLNLLQFAMLVDHHSRYLVQNCQIQYLSSTHDLIPSSHLGNGGSGADLFADPDFDAGGQDDDTQSGKIAGLKLISEKVHSPQAPACLSSEFSRLRYSRIEAETIARILTAHNYQSVKKFYGRSASEENIKRISNPPSVLHIATHGFYCAAQDTNTTSGNPLLSSCLALAGANRVVDGTADHSPGHEDGILTAYEVSGLNLTGTELVSLSACESGVGGLLYDKGVRGEGVFGLRRAFRHAGAKSILMSLWRTPDKETAKFMELFYTKWQGGASKASAMRQTMLTLMHNAQKERNSSHPLFWGGFVLVGTP